MYFDGSYLKTESGAGVALKTGSGAGVVLTSPQGLKDTNSTT
jgi:hypothetical protein